MEISTTTETASSLTALENLLARIEGGQTEKPDWLELRGGARLSRLAPEAASPWLERIHRCVLRGFRSKSGGLKGKRAMLGYWCNVSRHGFHDFGDLGWMKCYDSPIVESYDYVTPYLEGGLAGLDPYLVYSAVLGTWDYSVEDFLNTEVCKGVTSIVEPLAGSAEFCHAGHFRYPDMRYCMFDLDAHAKEHVEQRYWTPGTQYEFLLGNALEEETWKRVQAFTQGPSLSYIGKQSQNFFQPKELMRLLDWGTQYTDFLMLEVCEPYLVDDEPTIDDLTRPEMKAAGFHVALEDEDDKTPNPLTNDMDFRLVAWDDGGRRNLFDYLGWIGWQAPTLAAFGQLLDLEVRYFHSEACEFLPVAESVESSDVRENNTFMLFSRP